MNTLKLTLAIGMTLSLIGCGSSGQSEEISGSNTIERVDVKQSPDKYTFYVKDYKNMNAASIGFVNLLGYVVDDYGPGVVRLDFITPDGQYIDLENKDELKKYVVVDQTIKPNTEIKYIYDKDEDGEEYDNLTEYQTISQIDLIVKKRGSAGNNIDFEKINTSSDIHKFYIRNYVGKNLRSIGYVSLLQDLRDSYGNGNLKLECVTEDGSYIDYENYYSLAAYVVVGQSVAPNTELTYTYEVDENGNESLSFIQQQNIETITLNVKKLPNADKILEEAEKKFAKQQEE